MDEQTKARAHLKDLLGLEEDLTDSEIKWLDIFNKVDGDLSERQIEIIYEIYDRRM